MKKLKFKDYLVPKILDGSKVITWRLFDDKNLQVGDELLFVDSDSGKEFAKAEIIGVREKKLKEITEADFEEGHERYKSQDDMLAHYRDYYGNKVDLDSTIKIIKFQLLKKILVESRALISSIEQTRQKLTEIGAIFNSNYAFKDIIFVPRKADYNLSDDFLRVRIYIKNNWPTKKVVLTRKQTEFKDIGKVDNVILKKEFDSEQEASDFISIELGTEFERGFEYEREGWQYDLGKHRIFVEDIKGFKPSIEIEASTEKEIEFLFTKIGVAKKIHASMPEVMRGILNPK